MLAVSRSVELPEVWRRGLYMFSLLAVNHCQLQDLMTYHDCADNSILITSLDIS